jgi:predicted transcriptional regulator
MIPRMSGTDRVTISLPSDLRDAALKVAQVTGQPFSSVVQEALTAFLRGRLVDAWLLEYEAEHGSFSEEELRSIAERAGVPYLPPAGRSAA